MFYGGIGEFFGCLTEPYGCPKMMVKAAGIRLCFRRAAAFVV
jgi:hypothetical protein